MRLKDLREDRDETQRQMAALLNVGQSTYSMYENGQREIPLAALCKLADRDPGLPGGPQRRTG